MAGKAEFKKRKNLLKSENLFNFVRLQMIGQNTALTKKLKSLVIVF
jgi:hypothetical protein